MRPQRWVGPSKDARYYAQLLAARTTELQDAHAALWRTEQALAAVTAERDEAVASLRAFGGAA